jgi:hypothetical protein
MTLAEEQNQLHRAFDAAIGAIADLYAECRKKYLKKVTKRFTLK